MPKMNYFEQALKNEGMLGTPLEAIARSIFQQESSNGTNPKAKVINSSKVVGPMQVQLGTFREMADKGWDINNDLHNAQAGLRYIKYMDKLSGGVPELTAAGYYGGPRAVIKAKQGVALRDPKNSNAPTTLDYGKQVAARMGQGQPVLAKETPMYRPEGMPVEGGAAYGAALHDAVPGAPLVQRTQGISPYRVPPPRAPEIPEWQAMKQAMPESNPVAQMASWGTPEVAIPEFRTGGVQPRQVDFSRFSSFGRRV